MIFFQNSRKELKVKEFREVKLKDFLIQIDFKT